MSIAEVKVMKYVIDYRDDLVVISRVGMYRWVTSEKAI